MGLMCSKSCSLPASGSAKPEGGETGSEGLPPPETPTPPPFPVSPGRGQGSRAGVTRLASPCRSDCFSNMSSLRDLTLKYSSALAM